MAPEHEALKRQLKALANCTPEQLHQSLFDVVYRVGDQDVAETACSIEVAQKALERLLVLERRYTDLKGHLQRYNEGVHHLNRTGGDTNPLMLAAELHSKSEASLAK